MVQARDERGGREGRKRCQAKGEGRRKRGGKEGDELACLLLLLTVVTGDQRQHPLLAGPGHQEVGSMSKCWAGGLWGCLSTWTLQDL